MTSSDDTAIKALKKGGKKAYTGICNTYFRQLCFYAEKIVEDVETAEDIVHELFEKLWDNHEKIDISTSIEGIFI